MAKDFEHTKARAEASSASANDAVADVRGADQPGERGETERSGRSASLFEHVYVDLFGNFGLDFEFTRF